MPYPPAVQNVRSRAAANLGDLTTMSARVDQLATELAASARTAEAQVSTVAYEPGLGSIDLMHR